MRILPPSDQIEQSNIYEFENWVPAPINELLIGGVNVLGPANTPGQLPDTSYRVRYNERTESWTCDWFDENGAVIDQGRRLSINNFVRTFWGDGVRPTPMPSWVAFMDTGNTGEEATFESFGRSAKLVEYTIQEFADAGIFDDRYSTPEVTIVS